NRRACLLVSGAAFWALCEVLWNTARDAESALALIRLSSLGWVAIGPLGLDVLLEVAGRPATRARRALPWLYALAAAFLAVILGTDWIHRRAVPTPWGWGYELGTAYVFFYPFTVGSLLLGLHVAADALRSSASPTERAQLRWVALGVTVPLVVAGATDGLLPLVGVQVVHLATVSFAFLGATVVWSIYRYGYSLLAPSAFAREILDTIPDGVALLTLDGRVRSANPGLGRLLGRAPFELAGMSLGERLRGPRLEDALEGAVWECEVVPFAGAPVPVSAAARLLRDKQGLPLGRVLALRDVREVADLRRRLVTAGRLAAVGELAAGIAHEINNPIAFVRSNLGTLRDYWADLAKQARDEPRSGELVRDGDELIDECLEGIDRVRQIVHDVKGFAHSGEERTLVDVNRLLDSAVRIARPQIPGGARLERLFADVPHVRASARHLQQVFLNLLTNAAHAIGERGSIRVRTARATNGVEIRVEDDGCGIGAELLDRVFDPFFTTKSVGEGTGLGLAISYQIVRSHGGDIRIESAPGRGTCVDVFLPAEPGDDPAAAGTPQTGAPTDR
ncbi:MAG TPA: ATP-binding protein, partial [Myxococcota bacterium]|nr:ATP-binding protein [Myxococcota bacterium]